MAQICARANIVQYHILGLGKNGANVRQANIVRYDIVGLVSYGANMRQPIFYNTHYAFVSCV